MNKEGLAVTVAFPSDWSPLSLGELETRGILLFRNGFSCGTHETGGRGIPHLRPFNVTEDGRISLHEIKTIPYDSGMETYALQPGDVLYNNTNSEELVGKCAYWAGREGLNVLSNHMTIMRVCDPQAIDPSFLALHLYWFWLTGSARMICRRHVNQASIGLERMRRIIIQSPTVAEQREIAAVLAKIQVAVEVQDRIVATLKELKAATMAKLFREGLRGEPLKQTEIGEIPESWKVVPLGEITSIERGKFARGIARSLRCLDDGLEKAAARRHAVKSLFSCVLHLLMTGQVRVRLEREVSGDTTTSVVTIERLRDPVERFVAELVRRFEPERVILFGSHAEGSPKALDEVWLLVEMDFEGLARDQAARIAHEISHDFSLDLLVRRPRDLSRAVEIGDQFLGGILEKGRVLYARPVTEARPARPQGQRPTPPGRALNEEILHEIVQRIVETVAPEQIILFGSAARGEMGSDSDVDLLVVKSCADRRETARTIYRQLRGVAPWLSKDIIVVTPEDVERDRDTIGYIIRPALLQGRVVYAA